MYMPVLFFVVCGLRSHFRLKSFDSTSGRLRLQVYLKLNLKMSAAATQRNTALLKELFDSNGVDQKIADYLKEKKVVTIANFANFVDDKKELRREVLDHTHFKDDLGMLAKLKQAWREAEAQTERAITRSASGLDLENIDDPLPDPVFKEVKLAFVKHYSWGDMDSRRVGSDSYHGRCRREFERRLPSMFPVLRVRSLAHSSREAPSKRVRLNDDTYLDTRLNDPENAAGPPCLMTWFSGLDVMTNTWGIVGCFETSYMGKSACIVTGRTHQSTSGPSNTKPSSFE